MANGLSLRIDRPRKSTSPPEVESMPVMTLTRVVFPEPFGPISPRISPSSSSKLTSDTAASPPNSRVTRLASRMPMTTPEKMTGSSGMWRLGRTLAPAGGLSRRRVIGRANPPPSDPVRSKVPDEIAERERALAEEVRQALGHEHHHQDY